jgi:hypothetical protein
MVIIANYKQLVTIGNYLTIGLNIGNYEPL